MNERFDYLIDGIQIIKELKDNPELYPYLIQRLETVIKEGDLKLEEINTNEEELFMLARGIKSR